MTKIKIQIHDNVITVINLVRETNDTGLEIEIPEGAVLLENILNLKLILKEADRYGKAVQFTTQDVNGLNMLALINNEENKEFAPKDLSFESELVPAAKRAGKRPKFRFPALKIPNLKMLRGNQGIFKKLGFIAVLLLLLVGLGSGVFRFLLSESSAKVMVAVKSQPLTKSVQIKVVADGESSDENRTLKGYSIDTLITRTASAETTGEKIVGERAKGKVRLLNKTTEEKKFDKGTDLKNEDGLEYELDDDITVPPATIEEVDEVTEVKTAGEATADIIAVNIGDEYNVDDGEDFEFDDYDSEDFTAKADGDINGGKSETIKTVTAEDRTTLSEETFSLVSDEIDRNLVEKASDQGGNRVFIKGSSSAVINNELFSAEIEDEADELELTQEVAASGLAYDSKDLEDLLDKILEEFIPEGYELSSQDMDLNVEILGNTETTVLSGSESDLQVTIKTFVIVKIDKEDIRNKLVDKTTSEAQRILGGIQNIETYEIEVNNKLPFLQKLPKNTENITVEIKRE